MGIPTRDADWRESSEIRDVSDICALFDWSVGPLQILVVPNWSTDQEVAIE